MMVFGNRTFIVEARPRAEDRGDAPEDRGEGAAPTG
jgi:hypothetical protein